MAVASRASGLVDNRKDANKKGGFRLGHRRPLSLLVVPQDGVIFCRFFPTLVLSVPLPGNDYCPGLSAVLLGLVHTRTSPFPSNRDTVLTRLASH